MLRSTIILLILTAILAPLFCGIPSAERAKLDTYLRSAKAKLNISTDEAVKDASQALLIADRYKLGSERACACLILASGYHKAGVYDRALERAQQALKGFEQAQDKTGLADTYEQLGNIYWKLQDPAKVREYYSKSLALRRKLGSKEQLADALNNQGIVLLHFLNQPDEALKKYREALSMSREIGYKLGMAHSTNNIGNYYIVTGDITTAKDYEERSLRLYRECGDQNRVAINLLIVGYLDQLSGDPLKAEKRYQEAIGIASKVKSFSVIRDAYLNLSSLYEERNDRLKHLEYFKLYSELADSLSNTETNRNIANLQTQFAVEKQELENRILRLSNQRQKLFLYSLFLVISLILGFGYFILREKRRSEKLLLNILPEKVAGELKRKGKSDPQTFEEVSVLFSDFVSFTSISATLPPQALIERLSAFFTEFDSLVEANGCERIKTIGDAYLAVCGLPQAHPDHAERLLKVALGMIKVVEDYNSGASTKWAIRIGLHSGAVVGGIVGTKKYIYDVFGDTVNTASRMESNSAPMRINVSEEFYLRIPGKSCFQERDLSEVKGKGQMRMFFVESQSDRA